MKKFITCLSIVALSFSSIGWGANDVYAHPGRTDAKGGHCVGGKARDGSCPSGNYHCHNGGETNYWIVGGIVVGVFIVLYWLNNAETKKYLAETNKDGFKPLEPYATFDFNTKNFEIRLQYKHEF